MARPPKYSSPAEMQEKIDAYFADCEGHLLEKNGMPVLDKHGNAVYVGAHPPTVTGLTLALGFSSRQSLLEYQTKGAFGDTITRAKLRIEEYTERRLYDRDGARGAEFSLRTNFRWKEEGRAVLPEGGGYGVVLIPQAGSDGRKESEE